MVGGADDQGALVQAGLLQRVEHGADAMIQRPGRGLVGGDVLADLHGVGQERRSQGVDPVAHAGGREEVAVGLEEADRHEERLLDPRAQRPDRRGGDLGGAGAVDLVDDVVAERVGVGGDVLLADQLGVVAGLAEDPDHLVVVVVE